MTLLIVDDEQDLRDLIAFATETKLHLQTITADSVQEAIRILKENPNIQGIISDYNMPHGTGGDLFNYVSREKKELPFVLCTAHTIQELPEFKSKVIAGYLNKPFTWEHLISTLESVFVRHLDGPVNAQDGEYFPVKIKTLARINVLNCDLYVKLTDQKFVKLMKKGTSFSDSDFKTYSGRNIDSFYLKRKDCDSFLSHFTSEVMALSHARSLPWTSSCEVLEGAYESVYGTIQAFGFTEEAQELAKASAKLAIRTIVHLPRFSELFLKSDQDHFLYRHSALLAHLSCLLASRMGWSSEATQYKLALASFLHDMSVKDNSLSMFELVETPAADTDAEKLLKFRKHPEEAALIAGEMKGIPPEVSDIILHHHEKPDGSGIPHGLTADALGALTSLFIVAQDLVYFVWEKQGHATFPEFLKRHQKDYSSGHFLKIAEELRTF